MPAAELQAETALATERQLVLTLGGLVLELAGARLVTHEKIPARRFNFVDEYGVGPERQTAFFEHALDHYFQRAIRPVVRVPRPVPAHLDRGLRSLGFVPRPAPLVLFLARESRPGPEVPGLRVGEATPAELDAITAFWGDEKERPELRAALDIAWHHPNPHERLTPLLAWSEGEPVSAALAYRFRRTTGVYLVATRPSARGRGAASALVRYAVREQPAGPSDEVSIHSESARLDPRLERLGFSAAQSYAVYELPRSAALALPDPGPPLPPRWRPPRRASPPR